MKNVILYSSYYAISRVCLVTWKRFYQNKIKKGRSVGNSFKNYWFIRNRGPFRHALELLDIKYTPFSANTYQIPMKIHLDVTFPSHLSFDWLIYYKKLLASGARNESRSGELKKTYIYIFCLLIEFTRPKAYICIKDSIITHIAYKLHVICRHKQFAVYFLRVDKGAALYWRGHCQCQHRTKCHWWFHWWRNKGKISIPLNSWVTLTSTVFFRFR